MTHPSENCVECNDYLARRENVLPAAVVREAMKHDGVDAMDLFRRYMNAVHERHLSGLSITDGAA